MFFKKSNCPIGLDISDSCLKAVELKKSGDKIKIQAIGKANLPKGTIEGGEIKSRSEFIKGIKKILNEPMYGKFLSEEVVACLPESKTFIKYIEVDDSADIRSSVMGELEKNIPLEISGLYFDWQVIEKSKNRNSIIIGAAPKATVDQYKDIFDEIKIAIIALEVEPVAICRSIIAEESPKYKGPRLKTYGVLDIGAKRTSMTIYSKNTILFSVSLPISGGNITEIIASQLELSLEQAEKAKIICGLDERRAQGVIKNILSEMIQTLNDKISEVVGYYNAHFSERGPINKIFLCGGGSNIKNLDNLISESLLIETAVSDPFLNLSEKKEGIFYVFNEDYKLASGPKKQDNIKIDGYASQSNELSFSTPIGLALREIFIT